MKVIILLAKIRNEKKISLERLSKMSGVSKEVMGVSKELDCLILKEFKTQMCQETMQALIEYSEINDFPSTKEWDEYAKQNGYLSHISLKYKLGLKWNEIKNLVISKIL